MFRSTVGDRDSFRITDFTNSIFRFGCSTSMKNNVNAKHVSYSFDSYYSFQHICIIGNSTVHVYKTAFFFKSIFVGAYKMIDNVR